MTIEQEQTNRPDETRTRWSPVAAVLVAAGIAIGCLAAPVGAATVYTWLTSWAHRAIQRRFRAGSRLR
jgi:hypothetical protein